MIKRWKISTPEFIIHATLTILLGILLVWRWRVGMIRFFDVDEFTHLHWTAAMAGGSKPYIDFFTFFTPGFYWVFMPIFWLFSGSTTIFIAARVLAFAICMGIFALTGLLFYILRARRWALLPIILLAFLPMPYDKFLEVRPDNLAVLLGLAGVVFQVLGLVYPKHPKVRLLWFVSGFSYAASIVVLVKTLPFVGTALVITILDSNILGAIWQAVNSEKPFSFRLQKEHLYFFLGLTIPTIIFGLWALSLGDLGKVIYSLTRMPLEANTVGQVLIMEPHLFFFPNGAFYGGWGITTALLLNHGIWFLGIIIGVYRFLTPFIAGRGDRKRALAEALIATIFVLSVVGYVNYFPLKHSQYLIPIAIFIAWYAADGLVMAMTFVEKHYGIIPIVLFILVGSYVLWQQTIVVNAGKLALSNTVQITSVDELKKIIPKNDEVFDIEGRMIFWKDPYYICCLPIGIFVNYLSRPPERLFQVLDERNVPYVFQGDSGRLAELAPEEQWVLQNHYEQVPGWEGKLWKRKIQ